MRAMTFGKANMNSECVITSRRTLITGLASAGGLLLGGCSETEPPTYGKVLRMGDATRAVSASSAPRRARRPT